MLTCYASSVVIFIILIAASDNHYDTANDCETIQNGKITDNAHSVECDPGYSISDPLYTRFSCHCNNVKGTFTCVGKPPRCKPGNYFIIHAPVCLNDIFLNFKP